MRKLSPQLQKAWGFIAASVVAGRGVPTGADVARHMGMRTTDCMMLLRAAGYLTQTRSGQPYDVSEEALSALAFRVVMDDALKAARKQK